MDAERAITAERVTKRFPQYRAVVPHTTLKSALLDWFRFDRTAHPGPERHAIFRDATFAIDRGETVGLIGRNGAGKSTLLRTIAGIYRPDEGRMTTRGRIAPLIELGTGFHPDFTGRENAIINAIVLGLSRREAIERIERIAAFAELGDHIESPLRTYSTGMFARLAFSVALHVEPDVLLIDEILSVGDESFREKCTDVLHERIRSGTKTTVIVSHDLSTIRAFCGRVILVESPTVRVFDRADAAIDEYHRVLGATEA